MHDKKEAVNPFYRVSSGKIIMDYTLMHMEDAFIFLADRWNPQNAIDGRYIWLPIRVSDSGLLIEWYDEWDLSYLKGS